MSFKAGETVTVDVRTEDKANPDQIVVRWVPTPKTVVDEMCKLAKLTKEDVVHDYGCGDAVMLIRPIEKFGAKKGFGNDIDPKMVDIAKENVKKAGLADKITIVEGDILKMTAKDCEEATVVLLYIGDDLGAKLGPVLQKALKPGTRVVSHRFTLGDWKPEKTVEIKAVNDTGRTRLHPPPVDRAGAKEEVIAACGFRAPARESPSPHPRYYPLPLLPCRLAPDRPGCRPVPHSRTVRRPHQAQGPRALGVPAGQAARGPFNPQSAIRSPQSH